MSQQQTRRTFLPKIGRDMKRRITDVPFHIDVRHERQERYKWRDVTQPCRNVRRSVPIAAGALRRIKIIFFKLGHALKEAKGKPAIIGAH